MKITEGKGSASVRGAKFRCDLSLEKKNANGKPELESILPPSYRLLQSRFLSLIAISNPRGFAESRLGFSCIGVYMLCSFVLVCIISTDKGKKLCKGSRCIFMMLTIVQLRAVFLARKKMRDMWHDRKYPKI